MKRLFAILFLMLAFVASGANVRLYFVNPFTGNKDTNYFIATPISSNVLSSGGVIATGIPQRIQPGTNGLATNYFDIGWYAISNRNLGQAIVLNVYDSSSTLYDYTNLLQSGFNTYRVTVYGTNPPPTYDEITNALTYRPVSQTQLDNTNTSIRAALVATNTALVNRITTTSNALQAAIEDAAAGGVTASTATNIANYSSATVSNGLSARLIATNTALVSRINASTNGFIIASDATNIANASGTIVSNGLSARIISGDAALLPRQSGNATNLSTRATDGTISLKVYGEPGGEDDTAVFYDNSGNIIARIDGSGGFLGAGFDTRQFGGVFAGDGSGLYNIAITNFVSKATNAINATNIYGAGLTQMTNAGFGAISRVNLVTNGQSGVNFSGSSYFTNLYTDGQFTSRGDMAVSGLAQFDSTVELYSGANILGGSLVGNIASATNLPYTGLSATARASVTNAALGAALNATNGYANTATNIAAYQSLIATNPYLVRAVASGSGITVTTNSGGVLSIATTTIPGAATNAIPLVSGSGTNTTIYGLTVVSNANLRNGIITNVGTVTATNDASLYLLAGNTAASGAAYAGYAYLKGGAAPSAIGGASQVYGGDGTFGGFVGLYGGAGSAGTGGDILATAGSGSTTGGAVTITAGAGSATGGAVNLTSGAGGTSASGAIALATGTSSTTNTGAISITTGVSRGSSGSISISTGISTNSNAGDISIVPGFAIEPKIGGSVYLSPGGSGSSYGTNFIGTQSAKNWMLGETYFAKSVNIQTNTFFLNNYPVLSYSTNNIAVTNAGSSAANGTYIFATGSYFTNSANTSVITNNGSTWQIKSGATVLYSSSTLESSAWTLQSGSSPAAKSYYGNTFNLDGQVWLGNITSTNLDYRLKSYATNYNASDFTPETGRIKIVSSNYVLYAVTPVSTNALW